VTSGSSQRTAAMGSEQVMPRHSASNKEAVELHAGASVDVGSHHFRVVDQLGSGSYSTVWLVEILDRRPGEGNAGATQDEQRVALKDVLCKNHTALRQALYEVQLMLGLERKRLLDDTPPSKLRLPLCLTYEVHPNALGSAVRTAMTCLPGEQLDGWLRKAADAASQSDAVAASVGRAPPTWTSHLQRGCEMASLMVRQLGPTLDYLSTMAWHRDVNSHNIMVSSAARGMLSPSDTSMQASFWLCDLGLAVDSHTWVSQNGEGPMGGAWRTTDIGGDCRYWPPGAWMLHCFGAEYLEERLDYCRQYRTRLDVHGLGITAIEVLCSTALSSYLSGTGAAAGAHGAPWAQLMEAWQKYRETVGLWWEMIYSVFSEGGDFGPIHTWFTQNDAPEQTIRMLDNLHQALCACIGCSDPSSGRTLRVLVELTHSSSVMELQEACALLEEAEVLRVEEMLRQTPLKIAEEDEAGLDEEEEQEEPPRAPASAVASRAQSSKAAPQQEAADAKRWAEKLAMLTAAFREGRPAPDGKKTSSDASAGSANLVAAPGG